MRYFVDGGRRFIFMCVVEGSFIICIHEKIYRCFVHSFARLKGIKIESNFHRNVSICLLSLLSLISPLTT